MTQHVSKIDEEVEGVSDYKTKLADDDLIEIRLSMAQTLIGGLHHLFIIVIFSIITTLILILHAYLNIDVQNKLKVYLSNDDTSDLGVQMAQTVESILLFGIIDPGQAWTVCEYMIKKHSPLFDNPFELIINAGLPSTNVGRFRCFTRLLLIESQFLQYWQCFPLHRKFVNNHYNDWAIVRENKSFKKMENLFLEYTDSVFIQIPIDFENLDTYSYKLLC